MAAQWERWLRYAKAKLDDSVKKGDAELDRLEAEQRARAEGKPWLDAGGDAPTLDEARARIEHQAREAERTRGATPPPATDPAQSAPPQASTPEPQAPAPTAPPPPGPAVPPPLATDPQLGSFDFAAQQRATDDRLAAMRRELGLGEGDGDDPPVDGADDPPAPGTPG